MSLARVFCSWSIAAVLLLLSIAISNSAESEKSPDPVLDENGDEVTNGTTSNVTLTGNPQIDYIHDPNLPRELNGYNLSEYPFYSRVPKVINFTCDGRKDGFYANIEHKCQVYHHCIFEARHDFLCANYTAFDQRTFICQFVSDTDCPNSHMFFHRNKDLYVTKSTTTIAPVYDRGLYERRRPQKKNPKSRLRPSADDDTLEQPHEQSTAAPSASDDSVAPPKRKDADYADEEYYDDDDYQDYAVRRPARPPARRRFRKCRNGRRRGRRCRGRRPAPVYDYDDYSYDDDYDYAYYDGARPKKTGRKRRPLNAIPAGTSQVTSTSSSETPPPTTTRKTTTTTEPPITTTSTEAPSGPLDSDSVTDLLEQRDKLLAKTRRPSPFLRPGFRPSRQNDKSRAATTSTSTTTTSTSTTTERARPTTTTPTTTTTTEVPQYIYDYEYYEDDTPVDAAAAASSTTTTTTTSKPYFRGKIRGGNSAAALLEKQRVQQSIQVRVTEDSGTNTNTIRRRDNSNVQTPTRVATLQPPTTTSTTTTTTKPPPPQSTPNPNRPSRFWQRKSTVKSLSTTATPTTTTTTAAPYYQDYGDYEDADMVDPQPSIQPQTAPAAPLQQSSKFQPLLNPTHQYGTSPAAISGSSSGGSQRPQTYAASSPSQAPVTSPRGHGSGSSLSSSSYARPNKPYSMQQYSQSSSSSSSTSINNNNSNSNSNNNNNYNTNSYHRQRSPTPSVPKPEFISLVDEDYNNPYVSPVAVAPTSPSSTRLHGGGGSQGGGASPGYHQHPIRYFEHQQHQPPAFLFGAASEYNSPQFAFPPRNYPSPSNFQPYGHSTRRFSAHFV